MMAEALAVIGLGASIVAFLDVGSKMLSRLREFHSITKDASGVFQNISIQLPLIVDIMTRIEKGCNDGSLTPDAQRALSHTVEGSLKQITMLDELMEKILPALTDSTLQRAWKAIASVRKGKDVVVIMRTLEAYKSTLTLHFSQRSGGTYGRNHEVPIFTLVNNG